jgi:hypothetical protein
MVMAQKQTWRPVEHNIRPKICIHTTRPTDFWQRCLKHMMEKRQLLQQMFLGKLGICMQKTESRSKSFTLYKYQLKVD